MNSALARRKMTTDDLLKLLSKIRPGSKIVGLQDGKNYKYAGMEPYPTRGKFAHLAGETVVVLQSAERKRKRIILFLEPLLAIVDNHSQKLGYGTRPFYRCRFRSGQDYPNLHEYETHYKAMARKLKGRKNH